MQALYSVMVAKPSPEVFPSATNAALITALTTGTSGVPGSLAAVIPSMNDSQPACAWITVLTAALMNLCRWVTLWSLMSWHLGCSLLVGIGRGRIKKFCQLLRKTGECVCRYLMYFSYIFFSQGRWRRGNEICNCMVCSACSILVQWTQWCSFKGKYYVAHLFCKASRKKKSCLKIYFNQIRNSFI